MTDLNPASYPRRIPEPYDDGLLRNWAGNATLGPAGRVHTPRDEAELRALLTASTGGVRVVGSRMAPGRLLELAADTDILIDLRQLSGAVEIGDEHATFRGATPLAEVYAELTARGRMPASSPGVIADQTLGGALATGTHGQGLAQSSIADAAESIRMVLADGSVATFDRDHPWFGAVQLSLGVLGVITEVRLRTVPSPVYTCVKTAVGAGTLDRDLVAWNRDHPLAKAWWFPDDDVVHTWLARDATAAEQRDYVAGGRELLVQPTTSDTMNATVDRTLNHLRRDTALAGEQARPLRTVTRFRDFSDVTGDVYQIFCRGIATPQINVEIGVPLARAGELIRTIKAWHARTRPHLHYPIILRCTGASGSWLSPAYGEATCYFGFVVYYAADGSLAADGLDFLTEVEQLLSAAGGRPHWGKYFDPARYDWPALYPRWHAFRAVRTALDPKARFENAFTTELFGDRTRLLKESA